MRVIGQHFGLEKVGVTNQSTQCRTTHLSVFTLILATLTCSQAARIFFSGSFARSRVYALGLAATGSRQLGNYLGGVLVVATSIPS